MEQQGTNWDYKLDLDLQQKIMIMIWILHIIVQVTFHHMEEEVGGLVVL